MNKLSYLSLPLIIGLGLSAGCSSERTADSLSQGEAVVVHLLQHDDGSFEATAIDVQDEDDDVDCEQEGEHEGENEGCGPAATPVDDMIVGTLSFEAAGGEAQIAGIAVSLSAASPPMAEGSHWIRGAYQGADHFSGALVKTSANERLRFMGKLARVSDNGGGKLTLELFDREIAVDGSLPLTTVQSLEEAAESDVDCQQEGEHEGENEGC